MKKILFSIFVVISILIVTTGAALAAPAAGSALSLIEVSNDNSGPTFVFRVSGEFSKNQLNGTVFVSGGDSFGLHCAQQDETTVVCHTSKKVGGQNVSVNFGGATFWVFVPEQHRWCYALYDLSDEFPESGWLQFGEHCMNQAAVGGDTFVTYNPYVEEPDWTYYFLYNAPVGFGNNPGEGYYPIFEPR